MSNTFPYVTKRLYSCRRSSRFLILDGTFLIYSAVLGAVEEVVVADMMTMTDRWKPVHVGAARLAAPDMAVENHPASFTFFALHNHHHHQHHPLAARCIAPNEYMRREARYSRASILLLLFIKCTQSRTRPLKECHSQMTAQGRCGSP